MSQSDNRGQQRNASQDASSFPGHTHVPEADRQEQAPSAEEWGQREGIGKEIDSGGKEAGKATEQKG